MINIVGGVYQENCMHPSWKETYGSAGRGASCLAALGTPLTLHSYMNSDTLELICERAALAEKFHVEAVPVVGSISFDYVHSLAVPTIRGVPINPYQSISVRANNVISYGMLEGNAIVDATYAVYDPQNAGNPKSFIENGSKAEHLALILNLGEARLLSKLHEGSAKQCAESLSRQENAEVVVIKMGPQGALVWTREKTVQIPAFRTSKVWKIGSGDCFVAYFSNAWMHQKKDPVEAARVASKATAYFSETQGFADDKQLGTFAPDEIRPTNKYLSGVMPTVYLAGPFFNLQQLWMIDQVRNNLREMGLKVFSPFHDIGLGSAKDVVQKDLEGIRASDVLFAIADGLDAGTIYETGYARALDKRVIVYSECESEGALKMLSGSNCSLQGDYATAIYCTVWEAMSV